jgi:hypothetical protein
MGKSRRLGAGVITLVSAVVASMVLLGSGEAMASGGPPVAPTGPVVGVRTNDSAAANIQSSGNWAGYNRAGLAGQFHAISGSWNVPTVQKHGTGNQFSSQWVGIGGGCNSCRSIVQAGSAQNLVGGSIKYYAWYELFPVTVPLRANPGDRMTVTLTESPRGSKNWVILLRNLTVGKSVQKTLHFNATTYNTAEWIVEAPSDSSGVLPLPKVSRVLFTGATVNGAAAALRQPEQIVMIQNGKVVGRPSAPKSGGNSFAVCTYGGMTCS